jgi:hypothetical protein
MIEQMAGAKTALNKPASPVTADQEDNLARKRRLSSWVAPRAERSSSQSDEGVLCLFTKERDGGAACWT